MNSWERARTLTLKALPAATAVLVVASRSRPTITIGGSAEMETRLLAVSPR